MVSQPDIAVIQEAGHVDLIHLLPSVFLSLELGPSIDLAQPAASSHTIWYLWALGTVMKGFLQQKHEFLWPTDWECDVRAAHRFHRLKSWKWKCIRTPSATYKTRRFFSPAKSILVILVMLFLSRSLQQNKNSGQIFAGYIYSLFSADWLRLGECCLSGGRQFQWLMISLEHAQLTLRKLYGISHSLL